MADELVQEVSEFGIQVANNATLKNVPLVETEVASFSANFRKTREEAADAKMKVNTHCAAAESVAEKHQATLSRVRKKLARRIRLAEGEGIAW